MQMEETVLTFKQLAHTGAGEFYVDIAQAMSMVNRKLYRQQGLWTVLGANVWVQDSTTKVGVPYSISISGAARNWVTRNALVKMFHLWIDQQREAQDAVDINVRPGWEDFKVYLNENMRTTGTLHPTSGHMFGNTDVFMQGEWHYSKIVFEQADAAGLIVEHEPLLHILGPDNGNTNKGVIQQYGLSRPLPQEKTPLLPTGIEDSLYAEASDPLADQMQEVVENMTTDNNGPPYDRDEYPGAATNANEPVLYAYGANTSTLGRKLNLNGFSVPNGLIEIQVSTGTTETPVPAADVFFQLIIGRRVDY